MGLGVVEGAGVVRTCPDGCVAIGTVEEGLEGAVLFETPSCEGRFGVG